MPERIFITGLGVVSPLGTSPEAYWTSLLKGSGEPHEFPWMQPAYAPNRLVYFVPEAKTRETAADGEVLGRASVFGIRASRMCLEDAGIEPADRAAIGVSVGTGMGHADLLEDEREGGERVTSAGAFFFQVSSKIASQLGLYGPNLSVSTACSASGYSVSFAVEAIRGGFAEAMVTGGAEGFSRIALACFNRLGALDPVVCRPFDAERAGTVFGEGAAMMLLETESHARRRGCSRFYAEVKGYGWSCDGYHITAPEPTGQYTAAALHQALDDACLQPADIDCIIPHGTGTELNDVVESETLARVFGDRLAEVRVCGVKSTIGHTGGGAGAFSCLTGALAVHHGAVPPTAHVRRLDPRCRLQLHRDGPAVSPVHNVLVNAYAFGGNNISVILGRVNGQQ